MRAVSFNVTIPSFLIGKGLGGLTESAIFGGLSGVRFGEVSEPSLPAGDWVRLEILKAGQSNAAYHYLGSAKILARIGKAFADAQAKLAIEY